MSDCQRIETPNGIVLPLHRREAERTLHPRLDPIPFWTRDFPFSLDERRPG